MNNMWKIFVSLLIFSLANVAFAADDASERLLEISTQVQGEEVNVGDRVILSIVVENPDKLEILFPETVDNLGEFSIIKSYPIKVKKGKAGYEYVFGIYEVGTHVIPPIPIKYKKADDEEWDTVESSQVPIEVKSALTGEETDIKDLKELFGFRTGFWIFLFLLLIFTAAIIFGILWYRKKKFVEQAEEEKRRPAYEIAYEELQILKNENLPESGRINEYYTRLSDIVRHYLENRFSYRAPEMTTEEFMEALKVSPELQEEHKELLKEFLYHCDMVKFAKYGPTQLEMLDSFHAAEKLIDQTKLVEGEGD